MRKTLSLVTVLSLSVVNAGEFHAVGGQSISMGGAGVASASGSLAGYYNPALLANKKGVEVSLGLGAGIRENNIGEQINTIADLELEAVVDRVAANAPVSGSNSAADVRDIVKGQETLKEIGDENGIAIIPTAHLAAQYDNMGIGIFMTGDIVVSANINQNYTDLIFEDQGKYYTYDATTDRYGTADKDAYEASSLQYALDNGLTTINAQGLALTEVPVSYAHAFEVPMGQLSVGASVKLMQGTTYTQTLDIDDKDATNEDTLKENKRDTSNVGVDLGVLFKPSKLSDLQVGLVAKNLNAPSFDTANGNAIKVDTQIRTGAQYRLGDTLSVAADLDLTTNTTLINGYDSQMFGGGVNYQPVSWFSLRGGLMQNLANQNDGLIYTGGISLGVQQFYLDIAAQMASNTGEYDGQSIPKYGKVNVALVSRW